MTNIAYQTYKEILRKGMNLDEAKNSILSSLDILSVNTDLTNIVQKQTSLGFSETNSTFYDAVELVGIIHQKTQEQNKISKTNLRKKLGIFYTPFFIAREITNDAVSELNNKIKKAEDVYKITFFEPCVGVGVFTIAYIDSLFDLYLKKGGKNKKIFAQNIVKNIYAAEIDNIALDLYKKVLICFFKNRFNVSIDEKQLNQNIYCGDLLFNNNPKALWNFKKDIKSIFPEIFENGGFDVVITNPPYRRIKATSKHFENDILEKEKDIANQIVSFVKQSGMYKYANEGTLNYFKFFIEEMIDSYSKKNGVVGFLIPSNILRDKHTTKLRNRLIDFKLTPIKIIPESNNFFPDTTQSLCYFCLNKSKKQSEIQIYNNKQNKLITVLKQELLDISNLSPILALDKIAWKILKKIHKHPEIKKIDSIINLRGELDLTLHKSFFGKNKTKNPLVRGKNIREYNLKDSEQFVDYKNFSKKIGEKRKFISASRLGCQQIVNLSAKKRLKFCYIPPQNILGNSCNFIVLNKKEKGLDLDLFSLLGILNSSILDWRFKLSSGNNHINNYELDNLPIPFDKENNFYYKKISKLTKEYLENNKTAVKAKIDAYTFILFNLNLKEVKYILDSQEYGLEIKKVVLAEYLLLKDKLILNHAAYGLSDLDLKMIKTVRSGGNWKDIPVTIPSKRLEQIRSSGGRTTLYGRLKYDQPSYTISTYFTRPGNGTFIHPDDGSNKKKPQHRLISIREAARLQSFPDSYRFLGSKSSMCKQIGNAVPPLLAYFVAKQIKNYLNGNKVIDLFAGAGGLSHGFKMAGYELIAANDNFEAACKTYEFNNPNTQMMRRDIRENQTKRQLYDYLHQNNQNIDIIIGGPPCQGFSHAGKRIINDPRNLLFKEFVDFIKEIKPSMFLMENVPGILTIDRGKVFKNIKNYFKKVGYNLAASILNSAEYGVPQKRKRVFIIGTKKKEFTFPKSLLFENQFTTVKEAINDLPPLKVGGGKMINSYSYRNLSEYQKLMKEKISPEEFIEYKRS